MRKRARELTVFNRARARVRRLARRAWLSFGRFVVRGAGTALGAGSAGWLI